VIGTLLFAAYCIGFGFHLHVEYDDESNSSSHLLSIAAAAAWPLVWCALGIAAYFDRRGE
jgi:membrane protein DedA with SNARE-associated domain